jgi:excisionase family DNA binding protein
MSLRPKLEGGSPSLTVPEIGADAAAGGEHYTMAEAARLKGVSYHTVSRAVRRGKLRVTRLGRMALIDASDLRAWSPMRERAPLKYRRREPEAATPAMLDMASRDRVELASRLSTLYQVLYSAAGNLPLSEFLDLLSDRLAKALDFRRVAIWSIAPDTNVAECHAAVGGPIATLPDHVNLSETPVLNRLLHLEGPRVIDDVSTAFEGAEAIFSGIHHLFAAPLRANGTVLGVLIGDCDGEPFELSDDELALAHVLTSQAAIALDYARLRDQEHDRNDQLIDALDACEEAVWTTDLDDNLTFANATARAILDGGKDNTFGRLPVHERLIARGWRSLDGEDESAPGISPGTDGAVHERRSVWRSQAGDHQERALTIRTLTVRNREGVATGTVNVARIASPIQQQEGAGSAFERAAAIADMALLLNTSEDLTSLLNSAIERMVTVLGGGNGVLFLLEDDGRLVGRARYPEDTESATELIFSLDDLPRTREVFESRVPRFFTCKGASPAEVECLEGSGWGSTIISPLIAHDEPLGVIFVNFPGCASEPSEEDLTFAGVLAGQCAVALDKARLMDTLEAAHTRVLTVIDQLPQAVIFVDAPGGELILANQAAERLWAQPLRIYVDGAPALADREGVPFLPGEGPLEWSLRTGGQRVGEVVTVPRPDGSSVTAIINTAPAFDADGQVTGAVAILQATEQLQSIERGKDEFLSIVAHELRNPLTSLRGNLQLMLRRWQKLHDPEREQEIERFEAVIAQSDRMAELVNRLLDVSRADLGRLDISVVDGDATKLVRGAVEAHRALSRAHHIIADTPDETPVRWDVVRIDQVLTNLLGNAVKYTEQGEIRVTVRETQDDLVEIAIADQGPGIPDEDKAHLFDRYYRAPQDGHGNASGHGGALEGMGIGLFISHKIAQAHGGDLSVADTPGGGATFILRLPRNAREQSGSVDLR